MEITAFLPFFMVLLIWAMRSQSSWLAATGFACYLQGASPILLTAGGRLSGLAPAYVLLGIGLFHYLREQSRFVPRNERFAASRLSTPHLWLLAFSVIGVVGAVVLPRLFNGIAHAMPTRGSLDFGVMTPVQPSGTNYIQAFYLILNLMLFSMAARIVVTAKEGLESAMRGVALGLALACALGLYQVVAYYVGLPWPTDIINSNRGVGQFPGQMAGSIKRISSTFWEPSLLGYNFVGSLGVFLLGARNLRLGVVALCVLLLSTSSLGYFGLLALLVVWLLTDQRTASKTKWRAATAVVAVCGVFLVIDQLALDGQVLTKMILDKTESSSGVGRNRANYLAMQTFIESAGLGVGVGSARASSFLATLLATTGLPGVLTFIGFSVSLVAACFRKADRVSIQLGYGIVGFLIVWAIAIPDTIQPLFWFIAGIAAGYTHSPDRCQVALGGAVAWPAK
jgi:hypothetical protein